MLVSLFSLALAVSASLPSPAAPATTAFDLSSRALQMVPAWRFQDGDRQEWAAPSFPDSDWPVVDPNRLARIEAGAHWMRTVVVLSGEQDPHDILVLRFSKLPVAFEAYWDGVLAGRNGRVGLSLDDEIPGRTAALFKLPRASTLPGRHLLAVRFSNFHKRMQFRGFWAIVAYHPDWIQTRAGDLHRQYFLLGIYLISMFVGLTLFLGGGRHRAFLLFAFYSLLITMYLAINPLTEVYNFDIRLISALIGFRYLVFFCAGILLNVFFIFQFEIPHKAIHFSLVMMISLVIEVAKIRFWLGLDWRETSMALYSIGLLLYAVHRRKAGSLIALLGMIALAWPLLYGDLSMIFPGLPKMGERILLPLSLVFVPCIILSISRQIREQNRLLEAARVRSHRLETQLLKNQIQPHFISNTLHSIKSWFRENPQKAEKMIQALSDEFRIISAHSSKTLIPLTEEIRLCRNHLEIMGARRDVRLDLAADNVPEGVTIPPLLIHTLIENGITHAFGPRESGCFRLQHDVDGRDTVYTLSNGGSRLSEWAQNHPAALEEGMGLAYVRARLEESYPGRWKIEYGMKGDVWAVTIRITP